MRRMLVKVTTKTEVKADPNDQEDIKEALYSALTEAIEADELEFDVEEDEEEEEEDC